ncbi:putative integral membrane protein [Aspergillus clavatus NRRL 1]|uniref:Integral membrane protein, putative n=1 Tax=Aspergillus clavatus (strain ATCC 1007 / CBS 513.65 / DSM 816 / NCTC 3887 / NRRL 1 / QM 1276 / 107) TaxID=344612 RepID=A1C5R6_ASPCL|nr:integral membrane protein, putative [Aspergillus clavatus NRRL 1]EAW15034.1 integral membrane protein, putative [Aspergillus clavatus NRRL 1]
MTVIFPIQRHHQRAVLAVALTFSILAVTALFLRLLAHHFARKKWTLSDYFLIAACIFAVALQSISITGVIQAGIGYDHVPAIVGVYGMAPITKLLQLFVPLQFLWVLSLSCTKISILLLYLRIFPVARVMYVCWMTIGVIVAWSIATILAGCLICRPLAFSWDSTIPGGSCGNQVTSFTVTGVINLITDVAVLITPMPRLYRLQMARYTKVALIAVFGLGLVTCIISALRISVLSTMDFVDITFTIPLANIFSGIEPCLAVVLASIPMMRPLLTRSAYSPEASGGKTSSPSDAAKPSSGEDKFQPLHDETSQLWLRPAGPKHYAGIAVQDAASTENLNTNSAREETVETRRRNGSGGITVKQEWAVLEGSRKHQRQR